MRRKFRYLHEFFRLVIMCVYTQPNVIVHANARSLKDTYSLEIVIATPYNDNIDIIQDSPPQLLISLTMQSSSHV